MVCFIAKHQYPERLSKFNKMTIIVKYFGLVADITNKKEELFSLNESLLTTRDLLTYIHQKYTDLKDTSFVIAVNKTYIEAIRGQSQEKAYFSWRSPFSSPARFEFILVRNPFAQ